MLKIWCIASCIIITITGNILTFIMRKNLYKKIFFHLQASWRMRGVKTKMRYFKARKLSYSA